MKIGSLLLISTGIFLFLVLIYFAVIVFYFRQIKLAWKNDDYKKIIASSEVIANITSPFENSNNVVGQVHKVNNLINSCVNLVKVGKDLNQIILESGQQDFDSSFALFKSNLKKCSQEVTVNSQLLKNPLIVKKFPQINQIYSLDFEKMYQIVDLVPILLASQNQKTYTIFLQNDKEIRPTGGFMGSYVGLTFKNGKLIDKKTQDIYVPDGVIKDHVEPPWALQKAFQTGEWRLRDANFDPDFTKSVENIAWFFDKSGEKIGDGVITLNLSVVEEILNITGSIYLSDYQQSLTPQNLYAIAQAEVESDFFPGSTAKKEFLEEAFIQLLLTVKNINYDQLVKLIQILWQNLKQKNIQMYFYNKDLQDFVDLNQWGGKIVFNSKANSINDYFYISESNLGANKANCCIERSAKREIINLGDKVKITGKIDFKNNNLYADPKPPKYWGGDYKNFIRIIIPQTAFGVKFSIGDEAIKDIKTRNLIDSQLTEYGFFINIEHKQSQILNYEYFLPAKSNQPYILNLIKQSGILPYSIQITYTNKDKIEETRKLLDQDVLVLF